MIIGIDASRYGMKQKTGVERYSDHIIEQLSARAAKQKRFQLVFYCREGNIPPPESKNCLNVIIKGRRFWTQYHLSRYLRKNRPDLLFVPSHVFPLNLGKKNVTTIQDVAFMGFPEAYSGWQRFYLRQTTKRACAKADLLLVPSQNTKNELSKHFKCSANKIKVIPHGFTSEKVGHEPAATVERKPLILYIGRVETKKNLIRLIKAFAHFKKKQPEWKLTLAGAFGEGHEKILATVKELGLENDVATPEYISEEQKRELLQTASIFALVSLAEGFGFPILEAFDFRLPVLTSGGTATEEIGGKAAHYVNPQDTSAIQEGLEKLACNQSFRTELIQNMSKQLRKFSWEKAGDKTWHLLTALLST